MDYLSDDDLTQLKALYRDEGPRGLPALVGELGTVVRVLRAVPALVAELQEARAELGAAASVASACPPRAPVAC
jgi:hypothetical protein